MKSFQKQAFVEMREKIESSLSKKPNNIEALFLLSKYYEAENNITFYNLDSAYQYAIKAHTLLSNTDNTTTSKVSKYGITLKSLSSYKADIANRVFLIVEEENTELAYLRFSNFYKEEDVAKKAQIRRDKIAYQKAINIGSITAYESFLQKYPNATQASEISSRLNTLKYTSITKDKSPESYYQFILEHPNSPFRSTAELLLFKSSIKHHNIKQYTNFVNNYPDSPYAPQAQASIWFLSERKESLLNDIPSKVGEVEFRKNLTLSNENYLPFIDKGKFGFINTDGNIQYNSLLDSIPENYKCMGLEDNFFIAYQNNKAGAFNKSGNQFIDYHYDDISYFSPGVYLVRNGDKHGLIHQTGFEMLECQYQVLESINGEWVKFNRGKKYGVVSFYGDTLVAPIYDNIKEGPKNSVISSLGNKFKIIYLGNTFRSLESSDSPLFSSYEPTHTEHLIIRTSEGYKILQPNGLPLINYNYSSIKETTWGWVAEELNRFLIYNKKGNLISPLRYENVIAGRNEYGVKMNSKWGVLNQNGNLIIQPLYDTLYFLGDVGILLERDGRKVGYFYKDEMIDYSEYSQIDIQSVENKTTSTSTAFIVTQNNRGKSGLMSFKGDVILPNRYDKITVMPQGVIIVENRNKTGLANWEGKLLTPILYDGVANYNNKFFSLLKNQKFGFLSLDDNKIINTEYDALIKKYGSSNSILVAKKEEFGLINSENEAITEFMFQKIHFWNDSTLLGKYNEKWGLYNFKEKRFLPEETFDAFTFVRNDNEEVVIKTFKSTGYGLLSNKKGRIVADEYTGVINLGTNKQPIYFLEKTVTKSNLYITLYLDSTGKVIREQVLDAENYEKIICQE